MDNIMNTEHRVLKIFIQKVEKTTFIPPLSFLKNGSWPYVNFKNYEPINQ